jgi:CspA family cold shock protein
MKGKVKWFDTQKGFGFIIADSIEYFVHHTGVLQSGPKHLNPGDIVDFEVSKDSSGRKIAINVSIITKSAL